MGQSAPAYRVRIAHLVAALLLAVTACSPLPTTTDRATSWARQQSLLASLDHWTTNGKIALRSERASESASIVWRQTGANSDLRLSGPLGMGTTHVSSDGRALVVEQGSEVRTLDISTPDAIFLNTGWALPLQALPYWLKGLPSPDYAVDQFSLTPEANTLQTLAQDGWVITYDAYAVFEDTLLPTRIIAERDGMRMKVILRSWRDLAG